MHPGPRCPRHPSGPCTLVSGTPSLSLSAAFGLGAPFLRDIAVARSSGARGSRGRPHAHFHPWKPATRRAGFPVSAGWWAFALEEGRTKQEVSKGRKTGVWKARPVPLSLPPASAAPPAIRRCPLLTAIRPSGPRAAGQSLLASCPRRPGSRRPLGRFSVEHAFLAAASQKAEVGSVVGGARSRVRCALKPVSVCRVCGPPAALEEEPAQIQQNQSLLHEPRPPEPRPSLLRPRRVLPGTVTEKKPPRALPGGPVVSALHLHCRGPGSRLWLGG